MINCGNCKLAHESVAAVKGCYAGTTFGFAQPVAPAATQPPAAAKPASEKQVAFIVKLAGERVVPVAGSTDAEALAIRLAGKLEQDASYAVSSREASATITYLLSLPKPVAATTAGAAGNLPDVPAGHYAVTHEGTLKFYRVDRPTEGKWKGYTFVKVQASDDYWPVRGTMRADVLALIAADPAAACTRYGHELGKCGICNRTLTDEESRARGIGPVCAVKVGW